jgi:signal transduction histidine kinase
MPEKRSLNRSVLLAAAFLAGYAATSLWLGPGHQLTVVGAAVLCLVPLGANLGLLANTGSHYRRQNAFWGLWATACVLWSAGQLLWAVALLSRRQPRPTLLADVVFFLSVVPMLSALSVRPYRRRLGKALRYGYVDLALLAGWCLYLYGFFVLVPGAASTGSPLYQWHYRELTAAANLLLVALLFAVWRDTRSGWHRVYGHLLGASSLHAVAWLLVRWAVAHGSYSTGSLFDLPLLASFLWFGIAGLDASRLSFDLDEAPGISIDHRWALRLAVAGIVSLPLMGVWAMFADATVEVRRMRIDLTLAAIAIGILLLLLRQHLVDRNRRSLLLDTQLSLDKTNRLQAHLVLTEKLASLGELAAGAAREIGDPLTAIFGYTELLLAETGTSERIRSAAQKIQVQAHRTRSLVDNLLRFARQVSPEKAPLDLNGLLSSAVQLHRFHLSDRDVVVKLELDPDLPAVRGDPKLLLQVFYEIINNAADAMRPAGGGRLTIRTCLEGAGVGVGFADTGPGLDHPERVFDPFYTTKDVGKGTGLGLSMCYGIVKEHGGQITCRNIPGSGALFHIELPAVVMPLQLKHLIESVARTS